MRNLGGKNIYITIAILAIALVVHTVIFLTKRKHPSLAIYGAIARAIVELQNAAIENVVTEKNKEFDPNLIARQTATVQKNSG